MIKVSIIVPVYNVEKYLEKCLDSLINQTLKDIEIICVNDGSTDNSLQILNNFSEIDSRVVIINKENGGVSSARNVAMKIAKGEYVGFIDSDDWIDLDFYEKLYNEAKESEADIAVAEMKSVTRALGLQKERTLLDFNKKTTTSDLTEKIELCDIPSCCYVCNKIYKLDKLKEHNLKFKEGIVYEDVIYTPKVLHKLERLVTVPNTYYYYYRRPGSTVRQKDKKSQDDRHFAHITQAEYFENLNIDIQKYAERTKRFKLFGLTILKIRTKKDTSTYSLFNLIKWKTKNNNITNKK